MNLKAGSHIAVIAGDCQRQSYMRHVAGCRRQSILIQPMLCNYAGSHASHNFLRACMSRILAREIKTHGSRFQHTTTYSKPTRLGFLLLRISETKKTKRKAKKKVWVRKIFQNRIQHGQYHTLFQEMRRIFFVLDFCNLRTFYHKTLGNSVCSSSASRGQLQLGLPS